MPEIAAKILVGNTHGTIIAHRLSNINPIPTVLFYNFSDLMRMVSIIFISICGVYRNDTVQ